MGKPPIRQGILGLVFTRGARPATPKGRKAMKASEKKWTRPARRVDSTLALTLRERGEIAIRAFGGALALAASLTILIWIGLSL